MRRGNIPASFSEFVARAVVFRRPPQYQLGDTTVDSVELKALLVSRGVKVSGRVYDWFSPALGWDATRRGLLSR